MNRSFLLSLVLMLCCGACFAQTTVTGTVVDTKGNPMPGAKVQVKGTREYAITNMDGTFSINVPSTKYKLESQYAGWNTEIKHAEDGMTIKMQKTTWWNEMPMNWQWFAIATVAMPELNFKYSSPGVMFGMVRNWGWYVKGYYNGSLDTHDCGTWTTGNVKTKYWSVTGGVIKRMWSPIHLYLGLGTATFSVGAEHMCGGYTIGVKYDREESLPTFEAGILVRYRSFLVQAGAQRPIDKPCGSDNGLVGNFGVGYIF